MPEGYFKAFAAHRRAMLKSDPDMEPSCLDALIALQMRNKGFTREAVQDATFQCAQEGQPAQPKRDWQRYAERATAYAFGFSGDVMLAHAAVEREKAKQEKKTREDEARREEAAQEAPRLRMRKS